MTRDSSSNSTSLTCLAVMSSQRITSRQPSQKGKECYYIRTATCVCNMLHSCCRGLDLEVLNLKGKSFSLVISDLCGPIVPEDSSAKVCIMLVCTVPAVIEFIRRLPLGAQWSGYRSFEETEHRQVALSHEN